MLVTKGLKYIDLGSWKILIAIINFILLIGIFDLPVFSNMASPHSLQKVQFENHSNNLYCIRHVCSSLTWPDKWMAQEEHTRTETGRHIYTTHRCASKEHMHHSISHSEWTGLCGQTSIPIQCEGSCLLSRRQEQVTAGITAQDTGCYRSTFLPIHVHQPLAIFRPYPSNQIIYLSDCVLEIQIKY
jgi:hypothetical protein